MSYPEVDTAGEILLAGTFGDSLKRPARAEAAPTIRWSMEEYRAFDGIRQRSILEMPLRCGVVRLRRVMF